MKAIFKSRILAVILLTGIFAITLQSCSKDDEDTAGQYKMVDVTLSGAQEVPANASTGTGSAHIMYDTKAKTINYTLSWQLGSATASTANMHFHGAEDGSDTKSSPVIIGITGFATTSSGGITGTTRALTVAEEAQFLGGKWYLNVHSTTIPAGEIRGNIKFQ
ncbi:CHRD domain-containing protein [Hufsiella ginkgonis]|uniref:CHRD domain-containing protein n=1 Tax=Hufsiella ginkgonis TaxID=2695274 RepID=A0A7K1Y457_9SPHI|nr:CHRD domain-containing protein [Hufsiella ginkgonis]MXV17647.1 CHRD domain-containing protein [Hufsiella ginkgonis]